MLTPCLGPAHFFPESKKSAAIAPQIGPKEAPMMVKRPTRLAATPAIASSAAITAPTMVIVVRATPGIIVARLFPAMQDEKHIGATDAAANRKKAIAAKPPVCAIAESK